MNIGIIVYSGTGNTLSVAELVRDRLAAGGHTVKLERVEAAGYDPQSAKPVELTNAPDPSGYDALVFGAPVQAFSLSPVMKAYLEKLPQLAGRKTALLVTEYFPYAWMGGNRAARQMAEMCASHGAEVHGSGVVNWSRKDRARRIETCVERVSGFVTA